MGFYEKLLTDDVFRSGRVGLLCNQTAYDFETQQYLFQILSQREVLKKLFLPEHGLFAELQDQLPLTETSVYSALGLKSEIVSLYGKTESSLVVDKKHLENLDAIVIDLQDVGSRYYTFLTTASYLFDTLKVYNLNLPVYVIDRKNPAGRFVEGTILPEKYASFIGRPGIIHRHALNTGEYFSYIHQMLSCRFPIKILSPTNPQAACEIAPSPNLPTETTAAVYSGQCLWEGTNLSEGRGTTRPFEIFGAPYLFEIHKINIPSELARPPGAILRKIRFIPTFHKHADQTCDGFQIHLTEGPYHSLKHSLQLIRFIADQKSGFDWRRGAYEFRSDRPAIELLAGDDEMVAYLYGKGSFTRVEEKMADEEATWIRRIEQTLGKIGLCGIASPR